MEVVVVVVVEEVGIGRGFSITFRGTVYGRGQRQWVGHVDPVHGQRRGRLAENKSKTKKVQEKEGEEGEKEYIFN